MEKFRGVIISLFCIFFLVNCTHASKNLNKEKSETLLLFSSPQNTKEWIKQPMPPISEKNKDAEGIVNELCTSQPGVAGESPLMLAFLIEPVIEFTLDQIDEALEKELEKYVAAYMATSTTRFYKSSSSGSPELENKCFRFTRIKRDKDNLPVVTMDLIGQFRLTEGNGALQVRPLRLYYAEGQVKEGNPVGLTVVLKAESTWREDNIGKSAKIFEHKLFSKKMDTADMSNRLQYPIESVIPEDLFNKGSYWKDNALLPLIPWSKENNVPVFDGMVRLTLLVTEVSTPPEILKQAASLFKNNKGEIGKFMNDSAMKLLEE